MQSLLPWSKDCSSESAAVEDSLRFENSVKYVERNWGQECLHLCSLAVQAGQRSTMQVQIVDGRDESQSFALDWVSMSRAIEVESE